MPTLDLEAERPTEGRMFWQKDKSKAAEARNGSALLAGSMQQGREAGMCLLNV